MSGFYFNPCPQRMSNLMAERGLRYSICGSYCTIPLYPPNQWEIKYYMYYTEDLPHLNELSLKKNKETSYLDDTSADESTKKSCSPVINKSADVMLACTVDGSSVQMYYVTHFWSIIRRSFSKYRNYRQIVCNQKKKQFMTQIQKWSEDLYCSLYCQESEGDKASDLGLQSLAIRDSIKKVAKIIKHVFCNEANYKSKNKGKYVDSLVQFFLAYACIFKVNIPRKLDADPTKEAKFIKKFSEFISLVLDKGQLEKYVEMSGGVLECECLEFDSCNMFRLYNLANLRGLPNYAKLLTANSVAKHILKNYKSLVRINNTIRSSTIFIKQCDEKTGKAIKGIGNQASLTFLQKIDEINKYILSYPASS